MEAWKRGWSRAQKSVVIGDGAEWIWNLAQEHFPGAIQIVDLYHARQHFWDLARRLHPRDDKQQRAWMGRHQQRLLDEGNIEKLVESLRCIRSPDALITEKIRTEAEYFDGSAGRTPYPEFRRQHLVVGAGVIDDRNPL